MALNYWLTFPNSWDIANVRAVIAFLINLGCAAGVWIISYTAWKVGAARAAKQPLTRLLSLVSVSGVGDVVDIIRFLRPNIGLGLFLGILAQCAAVAVLAITAIISGPIARYSTRPATEIQQINVTGWLATSNHNSMGEAFVRWNETIERLNAAGAPLNQLFDFLPDNGLDWHWADNEWNSSWAAACKWTDRTSFKVHASGNYTNHMLDELPEIRSIFTSEQTDGNNTAIAGWRAAYVHKEYKDVLMFVLLQTDPDSVTEYNSHPLNLTVAAIHLVGVPMPAANASDDANFGVGPIKEASYTMASCSMHRNEGSSLKDVDDTSDGHVAYPWTVDVASILDAYRNFHMANLVSQSFSGEPVYHPSGEDLFRFYQAYMVSKDTQYKETVSRQLSVAVPTVQLSAAALAIALFTAAMLGGALIWALVLRRLPRGAVIPRTKVEWMMQGVREVGGREVDVEYFETPWSNLGDDLRGAIYGQAEGPGGKSHRTIQVEVAEGRQRNVVEMDDLHFDQKTHG